MHLHLLHLLHHLLLSRHSLVRVRADIFSVRR